MKRQLLVAFAASCALPFTLGFAAPANAAGTVILEGSDAIGYHCSYGSGPSAACDYANQTFSALGGSSSKTIAVVGRTSGGQTVTSETHPIQTFADLSTAGDLSTYVAIYFLGENGCCTSGKTYLAGRETDVASFVNAGGVVEIGNYEGDDFWDFLVGGSGHGAFTAGVGASLSGPECTDGETVTALGLANGFTQPAPMGCWTHQAYGKDHFAALGFTNNFFEADPAFATTNPGYGGFSSLLSNGATQTGVDNGVTDVPEPASWAMMVGGFGLIGSAMRRSRATRVTFA